MDQSEEQDEVALSANPNYIYGQIAQAQQTSQTHPDPATRERAQQKIRRWWEVLHGLLTGKLAIGSRTPVAGVPEWVTLEVAAGGFATGALLAEGPLQPHEAALLQELPAPPAGGERGALNRFFLSPAGQARLQELLASGRYRIGVPEEGALLVAAWLAEQGHHQQALELLETLAPFLDRLRFYPVPAERPLDPGAAVYRQDVAATAAALAAVELPEPLGREREAILVWAPLYDRLIALFVETVAGGPPEVPLGPDGRPLLRPNGHYQIVGGWPCQRYPDGWAERARALLGEYREQRAAHTRCAKIDRPDENVARLRAALERAADDPRQLSGREVGQVRAALAAFALRRGLPGSPRHRALREEQRRRAHLPTVVEQARLLLARLAPLPQDQGLEDLDAALAPVTPAEALQHGLPAGRTPPPALARKVVRAWAAPPEALVARGVLPSGEALARLVPQLSARVRAAGVADPRLRRLYCALYTAFRRRRTLLLFNLQRQAGFEDLPWVRAVEPERDASAPVRAEAAEMLRRVALLALTAFPQQILPNRLVRELGALAESAGLDLPLTEELAADIFMGTFGEKFLRAAQQAGALLAGTLYERFYGLDYARVLRIDDVQASHYGPRTSEKFAALCHAQAGLGQRVSRGSPAVNGTVIEQQQILTTHNLAALLHVPGLAEELRPHLPELTARCFVWLCAAMQRPGGAWRPRLRALKNSAYAWRQMLFFLALLPEDAQRASLEQARAHLALQPQGFQERLAPALEGLAAAVDGRDAPPEQRFLGWGTARRWLEPAR